MAKVLGFIPQLESKFNEQLYMPLADTWAGKRPPEPTKLEF
jgi:hypothetical protein